MNQNISYRFSGPRFSPLSLVIASVLGTLSSVSSFSTMAAEQTQTMETITVTGEKISRSLKETTSAVTVISEDEYKDGKYQDTNELASTTPNVVTEGFGSVSIRGISGNGAAIGGHAFLTGSRPRVATVVDGVTQSWSGYPYSPTKLWDTGQVEIFRGPQSTLQGTNSIGGAIITKTNDPTYYREAAVRAGTEIYKNGNLKNNLALMFNTPLIDDELALRVAADGLKGEGWMNYEQENSELDDGPDVDDSENYNVRAKILWEPASVPALSSLLTYNRHIYKGEFLSWANDEEDDFGSQTQTLSNPSDNIRLQDTKVDSLALDVNYELSEQLANEFHLSYLKTDVFFQQYPRDMTIDSLKKTIALENRLVFGTDTSTWSGVAGVALNRTTSELGGLLLGTTTVFDGESEVITSAAYGEASYQLNDNWEVMTGARLENEKTDRDLIYNVSYTLDAEKSETVFLPKLVAKYEISKDTVTSFSVSKGYNAGGDGLSWSSGDFGSYYTFEKETVLAYEAAIKSQISSDTEISANIFFNNYDGYQAFINNEEVDNIDKAHTYGLELEASTWATENLEIYSSIGLLKTKVVEDDVATEGNELPSAPHSNLSAGFNQYIGENLSFGANVTYVGEYYSDPENTEDYKAGDYLTADAQVQYLIGDFSINGYIKNLTDEDIIYNINGGSRAWVGQTRTVGISVTYKM